MANTVSFIFVMVHNKLDFHAESFWNNKQRKLLLRKLEEAKNLLNEEERRDNINPSLASCFSDLKGIAYDVDELIDDWKQSEKSKSKIVLQFREILARLTPVLESFRKAAAGDYKEIDAISEVSFPRSDDFVDLEIFNTIISMLLKNSEKMLRFIPIVCMDGTKKSSHLAQRIYNNEMVKSHFPYRVWVSVGENLVIDKIFKAIHVEYGKTEGSDDLLAHVEVRRENKFLLVLDDMREEDDTRLDKLKSCLNMWLIAEGSCVLVTTCFRHVADLMGTVPAQHLSYSWSEDPSVQPKGLGHEKGLGHVVPESVTTITPGSKDESVSAIQVEEISLAPEALVMVSTSGRKDDSTSPLSGHFEVQTERIQAADATSVAPKVVVAASTSGRKDELTSALSGHFEIQTERIQGADATSVAPKVVVAASTSGRKDESTSALSGHFEIQTERIQGADATSVAPKVVVVASTSGRKDESTSALSGHFEIQTERIQRVDATSVTTKVVAVASTSGGKDESTSALSDHFEVHTERIQGANKTFLSTGCQVPALSSEIVEAVVMTSTTNSADETTSAVSGYTGVQVEEVQTAVAPFDINEHKIQLPSEEVVETFPPPTDTFIHEENLFAKKSIKTAVRKIFSHMNNVRAAKIVVLGPGGVGKTTVLKALINHPNTKCMFDAIIFVTVSRYWSKAKIQNQILRQLSLCREHFETDSQVAERLLKVLKGKKFLLILDDFWEQIDLGAIGIPNPNSENRCKIIMAFRKLDAAHDENEFKVVEVKSLCKKEARELFHEQMGRLVRSSDIQSFAKTVVKGCGGLPLLIIVSGRALAEENDVSKWRYASVKFSLSGSAEGCQPEDVIQRLKFSFDQLKEHDVKRCFLHCALFPEDQEVTIYKFIDYCIKEGLITGAQATVRKRGRYIVDVLADASLIQVTQGVKSIKMHDLIRDLALGILSSVPRDSQFPLLSAYSRSMELFNAGSSSLSTSLCIPEGNRFLLRAGAGLTKAPSEEEWKNAEMVFLSDNELCTLPEKPNCPELLTLFLQRNCLLRVIPPSFFNYMASLEVLNLSETRIQSLPETISKLENLLVLILRDCKCLFMLPSEVGSLVRLEVLDVRGTEIFKLPDQIGKLNFLRHLEVSFYGYIDDIEYENLPDHLISSEIISKLCNLETLSIVLYPGDARWHEDVKYIKNEVSKLERLTSLTFHFPDIEHVREFLAESNPWKNNLLVEFKFVIGHDVKDISSPVPDYLIYDYNQQRRCLRFVNGEKKPCEVLQILDHSSAFYLDNHLDITSLSDFGVDRMKELKFCVIRECPKIKTVVHLEQVEDAVFPLLETLSIYRLWNLTSISEGILPEGSFAQLRILALHECHTLVYVLTSSMIQNLCNLEEIVIEGCLDIKQIVVEEDTTKSESVALLPKLKKLTLHCLPGLVSIWRGPWPPLKLISFFCCPNLKKIGIDFRFKDVIIKAEKSWWDALEWTDDELRLHVENSATVIYQDSL